MEGMWNREKMDLIPLSKSWNHPAQIINIKGAENGKYNKEQRAYQFDVKKFPVNFVVNANDKQPIHNLCFVLKNWGDQSEAVVKVDGEVNQGTIRDTDGTYTKIIYVAKESTNPLSVEINKN